MINAYVNNAQYHSGPIYIDINAIFTRSIKACDRRTYQHLIGEMRGPTSIDQYIVSNAMRIIDESSIFDSSGVAREALHATMT